MRKALQAVIGILLLSSFAALALERTPFAQQAQDRNVRGFGRRPQVRTVREVVVVDGKGKVVGATLGGVGIGPTAVVGPSEFAPTVLLQVEGQLVAVNVARDRFSASNFLWFDSENCTGSAWMAIDPNAQLPILPRVAIATPGQTLYAEVPGAEPQFPTIRSELRDGRNCLNVTLLPVPYVPMQPLADLSTVFTPPFSLRAAP